jgi:hypothetical protein
MNEIVLNVPDPCTNHKGFWMRKTKMCLSVSNKPNFHLLSLVESESLCHLMTCDGLKVRLPVTKNRDKIADVFLVAVANMGGGHTNNPRKLVNFSRWMHKTGLV